jgi:hypothetical protein
VLWAQSQAGIWWKYYKVGKEPLVAAQANSPMSNDYTEFVTKGSLVPAGQAEAPPTEATDPHLKFIVDFLKSTNKDAEVWQDPSARGTYFVKFPSGQWYSYEEDKDSGQLIGPEAETMPAFVENLNAGVNDSSLQQLYPPPALKVSQLLTNVMQASQGENWKPGPGQMAPENWEFYTYPGTDAKYVKAPDGQWYVVKEDGTFTTGISLIGTLNAKALNGYANDGTLKSAKLFHGKIYPKSMS